MDIQKTIDWLNSDEGRAKAEEFAKELAEKRKIKKKRFDRFEAWLEKNDFDSLIYRLIHEHDDDYFDKCYHQGFEPFPNNKLQFVFDYVFERGSKPKKIPKKLECDFANAVVEFKGYYFQIIWGQGAIERIWNKEDKKLILQV